MIAGGGEAEAKLVLRQVVLVADVEFLKGLAENILQRNLHYLGHTFMSAFYEVE